MNIYLPVPSGFVLEPCDWLGRLQRPGQNRLSRSPPLVPPPTSPSTASSLALPHSSARKTRRRANTEPLSPHDVRAACAGIIAPSVGIRTVVRPNYRPLSSPDRAGFYIHSDSHVRPSRETPASRSAERINRQRAAYAPETLSKDRRDSQSPAERPSEK